MGKAFTSEEKEKIRTGLMETALELFHDNGVKTLSIRELTRRTGIAQGSFYHFWKDKDALILDVMRYRAKQKLDTVIPMLQESLPDPAGFLSTLIYDWCIDLKEKIENQPLYSQSMALLKRQDEQTESRIFSIYRDFLKELADYWIQNDAAAKVDIDGLLNVLTGVYVLLADSDQFDRAYFDRIFLLFIENGVRQFICGGNKQCIY